MSNEPLSCEGLLRQATEVIGGHSPRLDAELLLGHVTGWSRTSFRAWPERTLDAGEAQRFRALVEQRAVGHPVAHLLGEQEFWSLPLKVNPSTLIPRPDTECLVEAALSLPLPRDARVLDLGTGTGAIALALASERPDWRVSACDAISEAVELATGNAERLGLRLDVRQSNWFAGLPSGCFDLIISNPPYIADDDHHLIEGDVRFEPSSALIAGSDGLDDIRRITSEAPSWLRAGGWLILEHGYEQGAAVQQLFTEAGFASVETGQDYGRRDRFTLGRKHHAER
ncbi:peptide chain release factor N(5)-glutamine methyltransferase [Marinobacter sp. ATCH36]|uniref:peptide chain release factor N(5)-glutamine methyltransferase n=1 Tax=Marinobacter sp. ATCH36 TaxID=2945106 RepID=UPI0020212650|nr:peptide chain release factor N(5)-glutamine methyltransferase [Marinobacter sp. ATCH36]MCL7944356.1 peptide chain release factor N(5)-glutamine methyltransferase [Marinobacter sp. ATCH36]